jgi:hypothetical protein
MNSRKILLMMGTLLICLSVQAHHSPASHYDIERMISVEGIVTKFRLINPHARIYFDSTSAEGEAQKWLAEGNASAILKRHGWTKETLKVGDPITISGNPAKDGSNKMDWKLIILEDGTKLHGGNTVGTERDRQLDELEKRRRGEVE